MSVDFADVDRSNVEQCVAFLDCVFTLPEARAYKQRTFELLNLRPSDCVLEVGCGTGDDATALGRRLDGGEVVGIDLSHAMIAEATRRAKTEALPVRFQQADVNRLPFAPATFSAVRIDRVLHILPDPTDAVSEVARVLQWGGRLVATEADWNSLRVEGAGPDLDCRMREFISGQQGADVGSRLSSLFEAAGLTVFEVERVQFETSDLEQAATLMHLENLAAAALSARALTENEILDWLRGLQEASLRKAFRASLTGYTVAASKSMGVVMSSDGGV
ncbi:methyltransferase domain-containing protein [Ensifer adhaerens]|uniref:methyltransferase domain-containing protein n=1 Tax=Ensifer adhaerens TaxID=106592 RepID=UPI00384C3AF0